MTGTEFINAAAQSPMERLRWTVLKAFNVLPCSDEAKRMTDEECLRYAANMVLDKNGAQTQNQNFSFEKFLNTMEAENDR